MCLAIPMKLLARDGTIGSVELHGVRADISLVLCPEAQPGDWLIIHAGFALSIMDEADAAETHRLLSQIATGTE